MRRWQLWEVIIGAGLVALFFGKLLFTNLILARGDMFLYFYPYWEARAQALLAGRLPLWNPDLFMGAPFLANSQAGVLYPLNWPLAGFDAPTAVKLSIAAHVFIAFLGAHRFARRALGQSAIGALLSALLFGLGGYLTAQAEHINQLQGLAWFPWMMALAGARRGRAPLLHVARLATVIALQILAGHTQTVFLSLCGAALYLLITTHPSPPRALYHVAATLLPAAGLAALLAAAQLLPTLELSRESLRSGGLPWREVVSFSLDPRLLGRALLPGYARGLFTEYAGYLGVGGFTLAAFGLGRARPQMALAMMALIGLAFALGAFNPLYAALAYAPPFNLFRVPARWLLLFAFGAAMLAGYGLDALRTRRTAPWRLGVGVGLIALSPLASSLTPPGETGPLGAPAGHEIAAWLLPIGLLALSLRLPGKWRTPSLAALCAAELFAASLSLPFNALTAPEAYASIRPAMTQLLARAEAAGPPADRFLSMSALRFDPGDLAELRGAWAPQLPPQAVYDAVVATKHKEVLSPNLSLAWGLPAVDGFDGGILPLRRYAEFTQLFTGALSPDGRLRENLTAAPDQRLLALVNARYLITDKVNDAWIEDVFYDQQFSLALAEGQRADIAHVPPFQATALALAADEFSGQVVIVFADGASAAQPITANRIRFVEPATPTHITLVGPLTVRGLSLIDERTGAFRSLTLGAYRLVHSGDVKIYENLRVLPRAFVAPRAEAVPDDAEARARLSAPAFDPAQTVLLAGPATSLSTGAASAAVIHSYSPERITLTAQGPGILVLTDAFYPGWRATVDGEPAPILRADIMFRAVELSEGEHTVEFRFEPVSVGMGLWLSGLSGLALLIALAARPR
jgi:hypothetical protein